MDTIKVTKATGRELMEQGITIEITQKPGAALLAYKVAN
jgi:hypothetical protein